MSDKPLTAFEQAGSDLAGGGILREFWDYVWQNKKWWLLPILAVLLLLGLMVVLSGTAAAPFIYTLF